MNKLEVEMLNVLKILKDQYGVVAVKSEFEAEGSRPDEVLKLALIARKIGLKIAIKIGGAEAVTDLLYCKQIGADYIIAPMVESEYALSKYIEAKNKIYKKEERDSVGFLFNLETITGYSNLDALVKEASKKDGADGVVFGRGDFTGSMGLPRDQVNNEKVVECCVQTAKKCKEYNIEYIVGGGMSYSSLSSLQKMSKEVLSRFETRKVVFSGDAIGNDIDMKKAFELALDFELLWLKNKREHYLSAADEDLARINLLEKR